jgi:hypothetical protein
VLTVEEVSDPFYLAEQVVPWVHWFEVYRVLGLAAFHQVVALGGKEDWD